MTLARGHGTAQRVGDPNSRHVSQRQRRFVEIQLVDRQLMAHPQRDACSATAKASSSMPMMLVSGKNVASAP